MEGQKNWGTAYEPALTSADMISVSALHDSELLFTSCTHFTFFHTLPLGGTAQALERQKEYTDAIRVERDELREEVVKLKDILKVLRQCVNAMGNFWAHI